MFIQQTNKKPSLSDGYLFLQNYVYPQFHQPGMPALVQHIPIFPDILLLFLYASGLRPKRTLHCRTTGFLFSLVLLVFSLPGNPPSLFAKEVFTISLVSEVLLEQIRVSHQHLLYLTLFYSCVSKPAQGVLKLLIP